MLFLSLAVIAPHDLTQDRNIKPQRRIKIIKLAQARIKTTIIPPIVLYTPHALRILPRTVSLPFSISVFSCVFRAHNLFAPRKSFRTPQNNDLPIFQKIIHRKNDPPPTDVKLLSASWLYRRTGGYSGFACVGYLYPASRFRSSGASGRHARVQKRF